MIWQTAGRNIAAVVSACGQYWSGTGWVDTPVMLTAAESNTVGGFSQYSYPTSTLPKPDGCHAISVTYFGDGQVLGSGCDCGDIAALIDAAVCRMNVVRVASGSGCDGNPTNGCGDPSCSSCG